MSALTRCSIALAMACLVPTAPLAIGQAPAVAGQSTGAPAHAPPQPIETPRWFAETFLDFREDAAEAARDGKRLMIYFGQDGCPYCKLLMQTTFSETRIADKARRHLLAVGLNLWGDREVTWIDGRRMREKELGRALGVQFTPTLLFFNEKAEVIVRLNGYQPPHRMDATIDYVSQRLETKQPYAAYMETAAREPARATLNDQPFFVKPPHRLQRTASSRPLLVLFERPHCASCDELHRDGLARAEVQRLVRRFDVVQLQPRDGGALTAPDGRATNVAAWAQELGISYAPSLVFFDRGGKEVFRVEGYLRPFHLAAALDYVASGSYASEPSFQRYLQARADAMRQRGEHVDLWK
jgi:thioredoxin-related protein